MTIENDPKTKNQKNDAKNIILKKNIKSSRIKKNIIKDELLDQAGIVVENITLPPMPEESEALDNWLNVYRLKMEVERYNNEQIRLFVDREKMGTELTRLKADNQILSRELEAAKINLEISKINLITANRNEAQAQSTNSEAMVYTFAGVVSKESVTLAITTLDEWSRRKPKAPVKLILTSPGGDILHGLSLYDFILILRNRGHKVTVVIMGFAASMGSILAQAGDRRVMTPNAYLMLHEASTLTLGKSSEIEEEIVTLRKFEEKLIAILCSRGKFTKEELKKKWFKKDLWFDAKECLKLGLIDEIGLE